MINVYAGLIALLFFPAGIFVKWQQKYFWLLAGSICLLASFGEYTPVRLWLYHYVPLMNSFRFPSVFRIFFIISLLIIAAKGFEFFLKQQKQAIIFTKISAVVLFTVMVVISILLFLKGNNFSVVQFWNFHQYQSIITNQKFAEGVLFQSVLQLMLLLVFAIIIFRNERKYFLHAVALLVIADLFFATQLNMNGSVVCERRVGDYQNALNYSPKQFPNSQNTSLVKLKVFDEAYYPSWSNNAIFLKAVSEQGYNPFQLKSFEQYEQSPDRYVTLDNAIFYLKHKSEDASLHQHDNSKIEVIKMQPDFFEAKISVDTKDTLCLLQAYYPNWQATIDEKPATIITRENGLMAVAVEKTNNSVVFNYKPGKLYWLLWLQFGLQASLLFYIIVYFFRRNIFNNSAI
jgi:hypothetical protein